MSVIFTTGDPKGLLAAFDIALKKMKDEERYIGSWERQKSKLYIYTLTDPKWRGRLWFKAEIRNLTLEFVPINDPETPVTTEVYSHFHRELVDAFEQFSYRYSDVKFTPREQPVTETR